MRAFILLSVLLIASATMGAIDTPPGYDPMPPPSPWGPQDEAGNTNLQTPAKALVAKSRIRTGESFVLAHDSQNGIPVAPSNSWVHVAKPPLAFNQQIANSDAILSEFTQAGTQFDALCHFGYIPSGAAPHQAVYYNQFTHLDVAGVDGLHLCGVEKLRPFATKAILVDVSRYLFANQVLPEETGITVDMTLATLAAQGLSGDDLQPGDVVLFRTGWERNWKTTPGSIESTLGYYRGFPGLPGGVPGVTLDLAIWLSDKQVSAVGADNWGVDVVPPVDPPPGISLPVHNHLLTRGIPMFESLKLEALADHLAERAETAPPGEKVHEVAFFFSPVRAKGAAGSPASPLVLT